jgi:hypothetical protein
MDEEIIHELKTLLKCAFEKDIFHYVENGIKLPCGGYACEKCIKLNKEFNCQYCFGTHIFENQTSEYELKPDKLCQTTFDSYKTELFDDIRQKWLLLDDSIIYFSYTWQFFSI